MSDKPTLILHDTLTRSMLPVTAADGKTLRFYGCGPTVYGPAHIGNFRTFVEQDVFRRVVELSGTPTLHVRNITDVDDKTIRDSIKAGQSLTEFTQYWTKRFHDDCDALNLLRPHIEPKATEHIPHQVKMIEDLIARGHAYKAGDGSVYFRVASFAEYGRLSHLEDRELRLGATVAANDSDEYSKDALADFALWKAHKPEDGENAWDSPWGKGRPGWHLECSAMALEYLGKEFDLHSGGIDLIFPHHENEIAQSCCATDGHFARHWMHIAHLMVDGGKMSKSLGNLYTLDDLKHRGYSAMEVRYTLMSGHYRGPLNFTLHSLDSARSALQNLAKFEKALREKIPLVAPPTYEECIKNGTAVSFSTAWKALMDDLNVPAALGQIFGIVNKTKVSALSNEEAYIAWQGLHFMLGALGITLPIQKGESDKAPVDVKMLADQRWDAKQAKDWATADKFGKELDQAGWLDWANDYERQKKLELADIKNPKNGFFASPLEPSGYPSGYTWTIASRVSDALFEAEKLFGPRDQSYFYAGHEFVKSVPGSWFPGNRKHIVIQLGFDALGDFPRLIYQLSHQVIYLLSPTGGANANNLAVGLAQHFSELYTQAKTGRVFLTGMTSYDAARDTVRRLLSLDANAIKNLRETEPCISKVDRELILNLYPNFSDTDAKFLGQQFVNS